MQILAVRLREVGRFRTGVAVEGFGPGLNVLAAANEAGKSTILRALTLLFLASHQANNKDVRRLRSDAGGSPQIACDFAIDGERWRLSKQYLAGRSAELKQLDGGAVYRGGDAEDKLASMLSGAGGLGEAMDLLWVGQGQSFNPPDVSAEQRASFSELVQGEIDQVTGAGRLSDVLERVRKDLFGLVTEGRRQPRRGGRLANAMAARVEAQEAYETARVKAERAVERERRLAETVERLAVLGDASAVEVRQTALAETRKRLASAQEARSKFDVAAAKVASAEHALRAAQASLQAFETALAELAQGSEMRARLEAGRVELAEAVERAQSQIVASEEKIRDLQGRKHDAQQAQVAAERAVRRREAEARSAELARRISDAREAEQAIADLRERYAEIRIAREDIEHIRAVEDDLRHLRGRQAASAAVVRVRHDGGDDRRFRIAGAALKDGEELRVIEPVRITADGVGEVEISPGEASDGVDVAARVTELEAELAASLERLGLADRAVAETRLAERSELERQGQVLAARIKGLAPDGLAALEAQQQEAAAFLSEERDDSDDVAPCHGKAIGDRVADLVELERQLAAAQAEHRELFQQHMTQREALARSGSEHASLEQRLAVVANQLPEDEAVRDAAHKDLMRARDDAQSILNRAVRERDAWREAAPDDEALAAIQAQLAEQERVVRDAERELSGLRETRREIEGGLSRDVEDGVGADAAAKQERLERLVAREADVVREKDALTLLERELAEVVASQRAHLAGPVVKRLSGYAEIVFPGVGFRLNDAYMVEAVERAGRPEEFEQLSDGTREQISILVRLALAQCIAERQAGLPVIFDDAMVYSDDARLAQLFEVLRQASRRHQVIVLSCHERSFVPLAQEFGGTTLRLSDA